MLKTGNPNINFRNYWNSVYGDDLKRAGYESQGTDSAVKVGDIVARENHTERFNRAVQELKSGDKVLDIGCGVGAFTRKAYAKGCEVWGVDISDKVIEANKLRDKGIHYLQGYIGQLDLPSDFDVVFTGETLEHLDDPSLLIKDAYKALKKGGKLILTTPLGEAIHSGEHVWFFEKEDITKLFTENGFNAPTFIDLPDLEYLMVIFAIGKK